MKNFLLNQLRVLLKNMARNLVRKYRPLVVGITGSVGKTSTKLATAAVLKSKFNVRVPGGNLNNELGLPLAIIGEYKAASGWLFWLRPVFRAAIWSVFRLPYPEVVVLEYGADRPGDIGYLLGIVKPDIAVVTAVGEVPVHVEFYGNAEAVAAEKARLVRSLGVNGIAILNFDDQQTIDMRSKAKGKVITFGFSAGAEVRITSFENRSNDGQPVGIAFKLEYEGGFVPVRIDGVLGKSHAAAAAAAAAVGLAKGLNLVQISEALSAYPGERGRARIVAGIKGSWIIDDTYNAAPLSTNAALEVLKDLPAKRKVAVLGDMAELGKYTVEAHDATGALAAGIVDLLVTVGSKAKFIAEGAAGLGLAKEKILSFDLPDEAGLKVQELIRPGDVVLVKGSQSARMEKVILEVMAEPEKAKQLLVRQYGRWLKN
ncbi:MAG: UDP-N-acetylmuramoyl-tripeptide--D-alanyl-D-alanine ligase [Patescibacteria group bacterium]|nr:UDP-N-acetylmuramoyl-tripeptide--D-alanyl-D-alanine ligase [Patescibacteria group bacterium]